MEKKSELTEEVLDMVSGGTGGSGDYIYDGITFLKLNGLDQNKVLNGICPRCGETERFIERFGGYKCMECSLHIVAI